MISQPTAEARLVFLTGPMGRPSEGRQPEVEDGQDVPSGKVPIRIYGQAQSVLDDFGAQINGATITVAGRRLTFDSDTKEVGIFSHRGQLFIEVTNHKHPSETVIVGKNGEFQVAKVEPDKKRGERQLTSVLEIKGARQWVNDLKVNGEVAKQLREAKKVGLTIEDNHSKSNGLAIFKSGQRIGEVVVFLNSAWQEELSRLIEREFLATSPDQ